jgi:hypothetical protein
MEFDGVPALPEPDLHPHLNAYLVNAARQVQEFTFTSEKQLLAAERQLDRLECVVTL